MRHKCSPNAIAIIRGGREYPQLHGWINFYQGCDGAMAEVEILGLPILENGFFAFHIHAGSDCAGEDFPNTGGHFNPSFTMHPKHAGDLPPLISDHGRAYMKVYTDRFTVDQIIGKTVVVHKNPDDFYTQPSGNAGTKIACGVIRRI